MRCFFLRFNEAIYALEIDKWFCCTVILLPLQLLIQRKHVLSCVNSPSHHHPFTPCSVPKKATQRGAALKHAHNSMNGSFFFHPHPDVSKPEDFQMCEYVHGKMDYDFFVASLDGRVLNF